MTSRRPMGKREASHHAAAVKSKTLCEEYMGGGGKQIFVLQAIVNDSWSKSFGGHTRPQPQGLGLIPNFT
jgi:hypothetical protein